MRGRSVECVVKVTEGSYQEKPAFYGAAPRGHPTVNRDDFLAWIPLAGWEHYTWILASHDLFAKLVDMYSNIELLKQCILIQEI